MGEKIHKKKIINIEKTQERKEESQGVKTF